MEFLLEVLKAQDVCGNAAWILASSNVGVVHKVVLGNPMGVSRKIGLWRPSLLLVVVVLHCEFQFPQYSLNVLIHAVAGIFILSETLNVIAIAIVVVFRHGSFVGVANNDENVLFGVWVCPLGSVVYAAGEIDG